ncbi:MAG: hypothetical protein R6V38_06905 [Roseovarius gahaiensis]
MALLACIPGPGFADSRLAPPRPVLPSDSQAARDYADILRRDVEDDIQDIQGCFRCLDEDAREVSEDYGRFLQRVGG